MEMIRNWNFYARYQDATGATLILDILRMVEIARVRYIKIKGDANPYDRKYSQYFAMRNKADNIRFCLTNNLATAGLLNRVLASARSVCWETRFYGSEEGRKPRVFPPIW